MRCNRQRSRGATELTPRLVKTTFADVAHPLDDVMVAVVELWLENLQVPNLEARWCKWDLV